MGLLSVVGLDLGGVVHLRVLQAGQRHHEAIARRGRIEISCVSEESLDVSFAAGKVLGRMLAVGALHFHCFIGQAGHRAFAAQGCLDLSDGDGKIPLKIAAGEVQSDRLPRRQVDEYGTGIAAQRGAVMHQAGRTLGMDWR